MTAVKNLSEYVVCSSLACIAFSSILDELLERKEKKERKKKKKKKKKKNEERKKERKRKSIYAIAVK